MHNKYVNIALDLPVDNLFTYQIPEYLEGCILPGSRVLVPFANRVLTGFVLNYAVEPDLEDIKFVKSCLDSEPVINEEMMSFAKVLSEYYLANIGEVLSLFIPGKLTIKSEIQYSLSKEYEKMINNSKDVSDIVFDILDVIKKSSKKKLTKKQIESKLGSNLSYHLDKLTKKGILTKEKLYTSPTSEKYIKFIKLKIKKLPYEEVKAEYKFRTDKQAELYKLLLENKNIEFSRLKKNFKISPSTVKSFIDKGIAELYEVKEERKPENLFEEEFKTLFLNDEQQNAYNVIKKSIDSNDFKTYLLFGVTGSGKTEIYIRLLEEVIKKKKQGIVLVPEISLTPQLIKRFKNKFGERVGVIHSKLSEGEKLDTYTGIRDGNYDIIVGPRSALFSPLQKIGIIIVDEEHDHSYKQENAPLYNARDMAVVRAKLNNAVCLLGSATPSMESFYNAQNGKYELIKLKKRATKSTLPFVKIVDLKFKYVSDGYDYNEDIEKLRIKFLSKELVYAIDKRLRQKESILLLQNRRGYHSYIECVTCGYVETCERCNVSLTYHKQYDLLKCHLCGFTKKKQTVCEMCGSSKLIESGAGTEKIEEELESIFPSAVVARMDSDTMTSKNKYQKVLSDFYNGTIDILIGTQIISKGLDFPNVTLVGVVNSDIGLLLPDFRSAERTYQLLSQVSGRSGRSDKPGEVIIQTRHSEYRLFPRIVEHDYEGFYTDELIQRDFGHYPPYSRVGVIEVKSKDMMECSHEAKKIYSLLLQYKYKDYLFILSPAAPLFSKVKEYYRLHIIVKSLKSTDSSGRILIEGFKMVKEKYVKSKNIKVTFNIDAVSML